MDNRQSACGMVSSDRFLELEKEVRNNGAINAIQNRRKMAVGLPPEKAKPIITEARVILAIARRGG